MNALKGFVAVAVVLCVALLDTGCKKDEGGTNPPPGTADYGSGTISVAGRPATRSFSGSGVWPAAAGPSVVAIYDTALSGLEILGYRRTFPKGADVTAARYDYVLVQFLTPGGVHVQSYTLGTGSGEAFVGVDADTGSSSADSLQYRSTSGSVTITSVSGQHVVGTYTIQTQRLSPPDTAAFTGSFDVTYGRGRGVVGNEGGGGGGGGTGGFTLNGAGFSNQSFTLNEGYGAYVSPPTNATGIFVRNSTTGDSLYVGFPGSSTGTFAFGTTAGVDMIMHSTGSRRLFFSGATGSVVVTSYGSVNGNIVGTFSGQLYEYSGTGLDSVTVTNGSFSVQRIQ